MTDSAQPPADSKLRLLALILLPILGILLVIAVIWATKPRSAAVVEVVYNAEEAPAVNTGEIIDATLHGEPIEAKLGYRYKVFIEDESDDRSSGIARLGGLVTFINGARLGQTVVVDVTQVRERNANAALVQVLSQVDLPPKPRKTDYTPPAGDATAHVVPGAEMDVIISEASSKNPDTEGVAKVNGLVIFVNGETEIGKRVNVRITGRRERMAFAEPTGNPAGTDPLPSGSKPSRRDYTPPAGDSTAHIVTGAEMDVVISESSSKHPDTEGVARVNGLVIFVDGVPTIGERVNVRITSRRERMAFAEPTGKPAGSGPADRPTSSRKSTSRKQDDAVHVAEGAVMDVTITESSNRNPESDGVARVDGLVVVVKGVPTIGERVNVRITDRMERLAIAEPTGNPAGSATDRPQSAARKSFAPSGEDPTAHIVPGAVISATILEPSNKNPETEGVAKVDGLVIFVRGATTPGQNVKVRITDRRKRIAMGEITADPVSTP